MFACLAVNMVINRMSATLCRSAISWSIERSKHQNYMSSFHTLSSDLRAESSSCYNARTSLAAATMPEWSLAAAIQCRSLAASCYSRKNAPRHIQAIVQWDLGKLNTLNIQCMITYVRTYLIILNCYHTTT